MRLILICLLITSCSTLYDQDNPNPKPIKEEQMEEMYLPEIDEFTPVLENVPQPKREPKIPDVFRKKVSIDISENADLKQAISKVARSLGINLRMSATVKVKMAFTARDEPFIDVINDLSRIFGWRYKIEGNRIFVDDDKPYFKLYEVHFLNLSRDLSSSISTNSRVLSSVEDGATADTSEANGSSSVVNTNSNGNFWVELEANLKEILAGQGAMTIHKQAGIISVTAPHSVHKLVGSYLEKLKTTCAAQVVIEAKIVEVSLNKEFRGGINWSSLRENFILGAPMGSAVSNESAFNPIAGSKDLFTIGINKKKYGIAGILHAIEKFGSVRTLSNPRITIMNNQTGIIKVAKQEVYFNLRYDNRYQTNVNGPNRESIYSNIKTVPIGLIFSVHPVINMETGEVILTLRPTISKVSGYREDPSVAFKNVSYSRASKDGEQDTSVSNMVPVVETREMDSVLKVKSGDIAVMGGLMTESTSRIRSGLPHASKVPMFGDVVGANTEENQVSEIIIFLRASIIKSGHSSVLKKDKSIYKKFMIDNRPLEFKNEKKIKTSKK